MTTPQVMPPKRNAPKLRFLHGEHAFLERQMIWPKEEFVPTAAINIMSEQPKYDVYKKKPRFEFPQLDLITARDVKVFFPNHFIFHNDDAYFDLCQFRSDYGEIVGSHQSTRVKEKIRLISNNNFANYCHWTQEVLPAVQSMDAIPLFGDGKLLLPNLEFDWQRTSMRAFGVDPWGHSMFARGLYHFDQIQYLSFTDHARSLHQLWPQNLEHVASRMSDIAAREEASEGWPKKIFVARRDTTRRPFRDTDWLSRQLRRRGFEEINLTGLPMSAQVKLFANAEKIVGLHGAGLVNLIYSQPGAAVLEIQPPQLMSTNFLRLGVQRNLHYHIFQEYDDTQLSAQERHKASWSIKNKGVLLNAVDQLVDEA